MFGSALLGVAIGLVLVYIIFSLMITSAKETLEAFIRTRSKDLEGGIAEIFRPVGSDASPDVSKFYNHPMIAALYRGADYSAAKAANDLPSYIPAANFSAAVLNLYRGTSAATLDIKAVRTAAAAESTTIGRAVVSAIDSAGDDLSRARSELEAWYDSVMERVSGAYKRRSQKMLFATGLLVALGLNVNSLIIAQALYSDEALRTRVEALAARVHDDASPAPPTTAAATQAAPPSSQPRTDATPGNPPPVNCAAINGSEAATVDSTSFNSCVSNLDARLRSTGLPIGWTQLGQSRAAAYLVCSGPACTDRNRIRTALNFGFGLLLLLLGYAATAVALTLGAPFWFDILNKIMVIRSTVKPREKSQEEGSKD